MRMANMYLIMAEPSTPPEDVVAGAIAEVAGVDFFDRLDPSGSIRNGLNR